MKNIILTVLFVIISVFAKSQSFTALDPNIVGTFNTNTNGNVNWGDYDNDGDLDVLISGQTSQLPNVWKTAVYKNDNGLFVDLELDIIPTRIGSNNWVDFDNDGDLDFFYIGYTTSEDGRDGVFANAFLYENIGNDNFVEASNNFVPLYYSSSEWGDLDNNGYYDLIISGTQGSNNYTKVYFNFNGSLEDSGIQIPAYDNGSIDLGDYDNDGDTDILISGYFDGGSTRRIHIYQNTDGVFRNIYAGLPSVNIGDAKWGDFNNDGLLDIALSGFKTGGAITEIYKNLGGNQFEKLETNLSGMEVGELEWGDIDGNGYADLVVTGGTSYYGGRFGHIYLNNGDGQFTLSAFEITAMGFSSLDIGDYDGDNDLDIILTGATNYDDGIYLTQIYQNELNTLTRPMPPTDLAAIQNDQLISFSWTNANTDSLTNNFFLHELGSNSYLRNPIADTATGFTLLPKHGNQFFQSSLDIDLPIGRYVWGVQTVNAAFVGSSFSKDTLNVKPTPDFDLSAAGCVNEIISITYTGDSSLVASNEFIWDFDSPAQVLGSGSGPYEIMYSSPGDYDIKIVVVSNGFKSDTIVKSVTVYSPPELSFEMKESVCYNENYDIMFTGNNYTELTWDFDGATVLSGSGEGPYILNWNSSGSKFINLVASNNGCSRDSTIVVNIPEQPYVPDICLVTVDGETSKNMLVWDYNLESVSQFGVYRETNVADEYSLIEFVDGSSSNAYIDTQSAPDQQSNRYKITALDSCGIETELSSFHKTIHLTINQGIGSSWNLIWDGYEGFSFGTYRIYRSLDDDNFKLLTEIASNLTSYTDSDVSTSNVAYQIEIVSPNGCSSNEGGRINQVSASRSNIARSNNVLGITSTNIKLEVFPNPTFDFIYLNSSVDQLESYELMTLTGQIVQSGELTDSYLISLEGLAKGVYLLKVNSIEGSTLARVIMK